MINFGRIYKAIRLLIILAAISTHGLVHAQQIAFPGAEGFGKFVSGGRGGDVIQITNVLDDVNNPPEGSLRWALKQAIDTIEHPTFPGLTLKIPRPLTIVFRVSGIIELQGELGVSRSNLTLAGQSAPGDGICLKNEVMTLRGENIIVRYLRFRPGLDAGAEALSEGVAGLAVENCKRIMIDHCSFSWANEECAIFYDNHYTTVQWCIASEGLYNAGHAKGSRSYGGVWGGQYASMHHNLIAHNRSRTIRFNGARAHDTSALVDYRNNVIYNWGTSGACYGGEVDIYGGYSRANMVNNYYKNGPANSSLVFIEPSYNSSKAQGVGQWYIDGNYMFSDETKTNDNWLAVNLGSIPSGSRDYAKSEKEFRMNERIPTESAENGYASVIEMAGAVFPRRDTVDSRVISELINGTASAGGSFGAKKGIIDTPDSVGGYPEYLTYDVTEDVDEDGMNDAWELLNGLNPADPDDRNTIDESGYTMLEVYLNELVKDFTQVLDPVVYIKGVKDVYCTGADPVIHLGSPRGGVFEADSGFSLHGDSAVFYPEFIGDYKLKYVYSDGVAFSDSLTEIFTVKSPPEVGIVGLDTSYVAGDPMVVLTGEPAGGTFLPRPGIIVTPTGALFRPDAPGDYEVLYQYTAPEGCPGIASAMTKVYPATGINQSLLLSELRVFPNPAGNYIRIDSPSPVTGVSMYNIAGIRVKEFILTGDNTLRIDKVEEGIYFLHILTEKGIAIRKFIKMK